MDEINVTLPKSRQDIDRIKDISGIDPNGKPKAQIKFRLIELYNDKTKNILNEVTTDVPVLSVFKHSGFVNLHMDFGSSYNPDLVSVDNILNDYYNPVNHFPYLPEELVSETYFDGDEEEKPVFFTALEILVSPVDADNEYKMIAYNPLFYKFEPKNPQAASPSIVQLTIPDDLFVIVDSLNDEDIQQMHREIYQIIKEDEIQKITSDIAKKVYSEEETASKEKEFIKDISGINPQTKRTKTHLIIRVVETNSDGTEVEIDSIIIEKPIVYVLKHPGYVEVNLDFGKAKDQDLQYIWKILKEYSAPANSVSYTFDELESGVYNDGANDRLVYFPQIQLALSPVGRESEYQMLGFNPAYFTLQPGITHDAYSIKELESSLISFMFSEETFVITTDLDPIDMAALQMEALKENSPEYMQ